MNNKNNSKTMNSYYDKLKEIPHFKYHEELLPFVGSNYAKYKILLVGESHYLRTNTKVTLTDFESWYNVKTPEIFNDDLENFNTRNIVQSFLNGNRKGDGGRSMFYNPENQLKKLIPTADYSYFAFFNYFQRPELKSGGSINPQEKDIEEAANIAEDIFSILNPNLVVFQSKKAYKAYCNKSKKNCEIIQYTVHPACAWWHRNVGIYGREKFYNMLKFIIS